MTTADDILEMEQHIRARWPNHPAWTSETRQAWLDELKRFDPVDVWSALYQNTGEHPPGLMPTVGQVRQSMRAPRGLPALPGPKGKSMGEWMEAHGWESLTDGVGHSAGCSECSAWGVKFGLQSAGLCEGHVWGSVDAVDLRDDGFVVEWCANCWGERLRPAIVR